MPSLKDIKSRIGSVKSTQKITKAMKMISTARLTKAKVNLNHHKEYSNAVQLFSNTILSEIHTEEQDLPNLLKNFTDKSAKENLLTILISTDKGLCGALNTFVLKEFYSHFDECISGNILVIGKKGFDATKSKIKILNTTPLLAGKIENHEQIIDYVITIIKEQNITKLKLIFPEFISTMIQKPKTVIFPQQIQSVSTTYEIEDSAIDLAESSLKEAIKSLIQEGISQMVCSEHSARMIAMDNATNNANTRIKSLTLIYNKTRQANITREILEIVAGSQAV